MMPVHKPGKKRNEASSYRPISLTSCIGKTMERMINTRLSWYLESNNIITPEQAGFRQHHSTEDQVTYIAQKIEDGFQDKRHTLTVWLDMEKAFDKVWKDGLRLKLRQCGVSGHMYQWISQFLTNRRARVHVNGAYSRKKVLKEGVPQGGVLSPTLFLVFINDILKDMPSNIRGAIYADDLVIWCTEEHLPTAQFRLQLALDRLNDWTKKWFVKINAAKTTFTIFTLSPKIRGSIVKLKIDDHFLKQDNNPTYLGITFDQTLTWRQQIEKAETRAKSRLGLMKKLSGASWGADHNTQKKVYTGYVRPVLEYRISVWGTASKTHFDKVERVQNQATRIITGGIKSTPIHTLETCTGLHSLEDRRNRKILTQAEKFKRLPEHPMRRRMDQPPKRRLMRSSFIHESKNLRQKHPELKESVPKEIHRTIAIPTWEQNCHTTDIKTNIPGIQKKDLQTGPERKVITEEYLHNTFPQDSWIHVYTDGSSENAIKNGGGGIFIQYPEGNEEKISTATGLLSTNYKAEAVALEKAAIHIHQNLHAHHNIVFLTDALSVLQSLKKNKEKDTNSLARAIADLSLNHTVTLQWVPSHCDLYGNEMADQLAKEGSNLPQEDRSTTYNEAKTMIKTKIDSNWKEKHTAFNPKDHFYQLNRREQVLIFRLRTKHNRLKYHLFHKFKIGQNDQCPCGTGAQTTEHILQVCPLLDNRRREVWPEPVPETQKLYGALWDLQRTAYFISDAGVAI